MSFENIGDSFANTDLLHQAMYSYIKSSYPKLYSSFTIKLFLGNTLNGLASRSLNFVSLLAVRLSSILSNSLLSFLV